MADFGRWRESSGESGFGLDVEAVAESNTLDDSWQLPRRIKVLETKGDQTGSLGTAYKRDVLKLMSDNFAWHSTVSAGTPELVQQNGETVEGTLSC